MTPPEPMEPSPPPPPPGPHAYPPEVYPVPPPQKHPPQQPYGVPFGFAPGHPYGYPQPYYPVPTGPPPPRVWTVFVAFIAAFLAGMAGPMIVVGVLAVVLRGDELAGATPDEAAKVFESAFLAPGVFLPAIASTQVALIAVTLCAAALSPVPWGRRLRLGRPRLPWYGYVVAVLGTLALGFGSGIAIELLGLGDEGTLKMFQDALGSLRGWLLVVAALVVGLSPGFGEEMLFRGYMQTRLTQRWGRLASIALVSLLFALIHMDLVQGTFVILLGLYLGELTERTGSIWPAIVCHAVNNSLSTLLAPLAATMPGGDVTSEQGLMASYVSLGVCGAVLLASLVYLLRRPVVPVEDTNPRLQPAFPVASYPAPPPYQAPEPPARW